MNEWGVSGIIAAIVTFGIAVATPIVKLTKAITTLDATVKATVSQLAEFKTDNTTSHKRLWEKNAEQDKTINDHETRISVLERKREE